MRRDEALRILREHRAELAALKVASLRLFGSVARDEARPDSDVDLLVTFSAPVGYFHVFRVQDEIAAMLGRPVDLIVEDGLKPRYREHIMREAIPATEGLERSDR
ncbi:MAG TPA: nucleotidyltransferase family protein [Dehalococcoidia bacterium]|nr:nucleotidyltransferase family protein [Dehalococcoidia bacterium]